MAGKQGGKGRGVIIKKEEIIEGGHHGGAWKVAYADFVTAMMAFFLLMWLLNATTEEQRRGLADYFTPTNVMSQGSSGSGRIFGGRTPYERGELVSDRGAKSVVPGQAEQVNDQDDPEYDQAPNASTRGAAEDQRRPEGNQPDPGGGKGTRASAQAGARESGGGTAAIASPNQAQALGQAQRLANAGSGTQSSTPTVLGRPIDDAAMRAEMERRERESFDQAAEQMRDAVRNDPSLQDLANQLAIDQTPEGLRIQLLDEDRSPMFASGSAVLNERARALLMKVAPVVAKMNQRLSIAGHTDATPFRGTDRSNWELSAERANATRRLLVEQGIAEQRLRSVTGNADRDPLLPADPFAAVNRRIAITVLRDTKGTP
ncbi:MAG: OmpA family protein [Alphaproteobacteria bacterium]|nr:OmpA family protein [Alphaproteobacteria bacterium]